MVSQLCRREELKNKYQSVAIDTVDEAWLLCTKYICNQNGLEKLGDMPFGGAYDLAKKEFAGTFRDLVYNGYGLIFISHSTEKTYKNDKGQEYTKIVPALQTRPFDVINKMVDLIAYILLSQDINISSLKLSLAMMPLLMQFMMQLIRKLRIAAAKQRMKPHQIQFLILTS